MRKLLYILIFLLLLISCQLGKKTKVVNIENRFELHLPKSFLKLNKLNPEAALVYGNPLSELYAMVIEESKEEMNEDEEENIFEETSLEDYFELCLDMWSENHNTTSQLSDFDKITLNNLPAYFGEKKAVIDGIDIYFIIAVVKGKNAFYQIYTWTLSDQKDKYKSEFAKIIHSFKEL